MHASVLVESEERDEALQLTLHPALFTNSSEIHSTKTAFASTQITAGRDDPEYPEDDQNSALELQDASVQEYRFTLS